jgi:hypothetical protein
VSRADTAEREARSALENGTRRDYLSPAAQDAYDRLSGQDPSAFPAAAARPDPRGLRGAARVAALHGRKVFACRIPWTRAGLNVAFASAELPNVAETIEGIEEEGWRLDMIGPGNDIYIFRRTE